VGDAFTALKQHLGLILWDQRDFEELLILDTEGRVIVSTFEGHEGTTAESLEYFQRGRAATYVQQVFLSPLTEQLTMVIATPIRDEKIAELGVLVARLNLTRFFQLINDTTGLGDTGETVVIKKIEDTLSFQAPTRHDAEAALKRTIPVGSENAYALQEAARGQAGTGREVDYRGVATFAAWQFVPSLNWGLIVKIDRDEALQAVDDARRSILLSVILVIVLIIPASIIAARTLVEPLRKLKEATDRISRGDFAVQLDIRSGDEIGELADSFERMVAAIKYFRARREEEEDLDSDREARARPPSPPEDR
jgi:methyl-accepting chemotaxis protein